MRSTKSARLLVVKVAEVSTQRMVDLLHRRSLVLLRQGKTFEAIAVSKAMLDRMGTR